MTPQKKIAELPEVMAYFNQYVDWLKVRGMDDDAYSYELSRLAYETHKYFECQEKAAEREAKGLPGFYNEFENDTIQVNALHTISKDSGSAMDKLGAMFGFTPADFNKIKDLVKVAEKEPDLLDATIAGTVNLT